MSRVQLHGYKYSVYHRIVRLVLLLKEVEYETIEVNPFDEMSNEYLNLNPFGRVPTLVHGTFSIFETNAITRYVDRAFDGQSLQPERADALARMDQVISVIDAYGYWPMVRQVASHGFFRDQFGETSNPDEISAGVKKSHRALSFLNGIVKEGKVLNGKAFTLADCHLVPMLDYFVRADVGMDALSQYAALQDWWKRVAHLEAVVQTAPLESINADHIVNSA